MSEELPIIQSDNDWLDLRDGEKGRVVGKLYHALKSHDTSVTVGLPDWDLLLIEIPGGYGGHPLDENTPVDITVTRNEDGLECSTTDILPPAE